MEIFFQYCQNYFENPYIKKETKSFITPEAPLEICDVCDEILNNEPNINNETEHVLEVLQLTSLEYRLQGSAF